MTRPSLLWLPVSLVLTGCTGGPEQPVAAEQPRPTVARTGNVVRFPADSPKLSRFTVATVETATVPLDELTVPAVVEMIPHRVSRVTPPLAGRLTKLLVGLGDSVRAGQPVAILDSPEAAAALSAYRQAEANVAQERAALAKAEADAERSRDLLENRAIAQKEVLAAETLVTQGRQLVNQAEAARQEALRRLEILGLSTGDMQQNITVRSAMPGKVVEVTAAQGEFRNDPAAPLLTIADLSTVWVAADLAESQIRHIRAGQMVNISFPAFPGQAFRGRIVRIADVVLPETRTIRVRAELPNPRGDFRPEMFAEVQVNRGAETLPVVPRAAIFAKQEGDSVYREIGHGEFEEVLVTVAWQDANRAAIRSGLQPGDRVVTDGVTQLRAY